MNQVHPPLTPFGAENVPVLTGRESAAFDAYAISELGVPQPVLMENAGRSAALVAHRLFPDGRVVAFVGAGNNGGDALVLARTLRAWGRNVAVVLVADRPTDDPLLHGWDVPVLTDAALDASEGWGSFLEGAALVVDGVLGTGVRGVPRERQAAAIRRMNQAGRPVLAIDIPSGVSADDGSAAGEAVRAGVTVTFGTPKLGTLLHPGRACAGRVVAVEMAFPPMEGRAFVGQAVTPLWAQARLPERPKDTHKNAVGRVLVVAGRPGMAGAAVLAVRGALRGGAGLVQVCSPVENREILQSAVPEAIYVDPDAEGALETALAQAHAVVAGPGLGTDESARALLERVLDGPGATLVLDADALNLLAGRAPERIGALAPRPVLVTPHLAELSRLTRREADDLKADRAGAALGAAESLGCTVLFKGAPSLVARVGRPLLVDTQGSSDLAAAGMGDVLAGVCGAMTAQGLEPAEAAAVALYVSGRAAVLTGLGPALTPGDVVEALPTALRERGAGVSDLALPFVVFDLPAAR